MVEFALILTPLMMILLGIMQIALVLHAYVSIENAAREGAREATIYLYDRTKTKLQNDEGRANAARNGILASMGVLSRTAPQFAGTGSWTASGSTYTSGDVRITYSLPTGVTESDPRTGQYVRVQATYHLDLIIPFIAAMLPHDASNRMTLTGDVTMVVN
ncbi:MAG TPA: TadE/TadG family type IV pilus assembly protein [Candidatus Limnocylindrales bacterium]|nr:TadE/TadG family type IV pilus assembly protein [Candidatus Limnocylindrales bacterium]